MKPINSMTYRTQGLRPRSSWLRWASLLMALAVFGVTRVASAQLGVGILSGQVRDVSTKKPLADVVVTATSPALQGDQVAVTDKSGTFRIPNLPPGDYVLRYEADTFRPYARSGIPLRATITLRVDAELLPETLKAEEVTVVAQAPTVDVGSTRSGVTLNSEFFNRVAVAPPTGKGGAIRSFEQLVDVAPTGRNDLYGGSVGGTTSPENVYLIDGLSVGDAGFGYNGSPLGLDFIKEATIVTGGYLPEYGRGGGGVLDIVTKSGSNEFHGSFFGNLTPWQAAPKFPPPQDTISTTSRLSSTRDFGFDLGGPIIKDKLWFYVGADLAQSSYTLSRDLNVLRTGADGKYVYDNDGLIESDRIPGTHRTERAEATQWQYLGKLTYSPTHNDRLELTHRGTPSRSGGSGNYSIDYETGLPNVYANPQSLSIIGPYSSQAYRQIADSYDTALHWTHSTENKKLTFDTTIGWHHARTANLPSDGSSVGGGGLASTPLYVYEQTSPAPHSITEFENLANPGICVNTVDGGDAKCPAAQYAVGGPQIIQDRTENRYQLREVATFVTEGLGHHVFKAGMEAEYLGFNTAKAYPGGVLLEQYGAGVNVLDLRRYGGLSAPDTPYILNVLHHDNHSLSFGAFAQDSWSILDKVTLNLGFRYDTQALYGDQGGIGISLPNQWSPRIGAIFDPTQKGHAKIFANYAIYYQSLPLDIVDRSVGSGEPSIRSRRPYANCNPALPGYPAVCDTPGNLNSVGGPADVNQKWAYTGVGTTAIDPDLKPQSTSEFSAGGEYELIPNGRLGLTYVRKWLNSAIEDMSRDEANTYFLGNPGKGIASDFPKAKRNYDAAILAFTKTFSDSWLAQASYTLSWLRGNYEGFFRAQTGQLDPGANSDFDLRSLTVNRSGDLSGDRRHELKLFIAKDFELAPRHHGNLGLTYIGRSGAPTNYLASHPVYGDDEVFLLPRGSGERMPWVHEIDLHVGYTFFETKNQTVAVTCDVFNLFNFQAVTRRGETYTLRSVNPITGAAASNAFVNGDKKNVDPSLIHPSDDDPRPFDSTDKNRSFGAPLSYQQPISMRFGIKTTF